MPSLKITYSVECNDLDDALQLLYIKMQSLPLSMRLPLPSAPARSHLPYVGGDVDFIANCSEDGGVQTARSSIAGKRENERSVECIVEGCTEVFPARLIRHHVAWHLFLGGVGGGGSSGSGSGGSGGGGDAPCGLCAVRPQMQFSAEGASGGGPVWVEKKGRPSNLISGASQWERLTSAWVPQPSPPRRSPQQTSLSSAPSAEPSRWRSSFGSTRA